jgi:hypothetical protein
MPINQSFLNQFTNNTRQGLIDLSDQEQDIFLAFYDKNKKSELVILLFSIFFPIQLFLFNKTLLGVFFWITGGGFFVWYVIEIFLAIPRTRDYNEELAVCILYLMNNKNQ